MEGITDFQLFHSYNELVKQGKANPITCQFCGYGYIIGHNHGELRLVCYSCDTSIVPGLDTISNVRAVVKEHIL